MSGLKSYREVNARDQSVSFGISRMEDIYARRRGVKDEPHRHDFYTVLLVIDGEGRHVIDFHQFELGPRQVYFISPGQVHQLVEKKPTHGFSMVFSRQFLVENNISVSFIEDLNLFNNYGYAPPLELGEEVIVHLQAYAEQMLEWQNSMLKYRYQAIGSNLKLFLIECNHNCDLDIKSFDDQGNSLIGDFRQMVDKKFKDWHSINQYAEALSITPDHLNRVVKYKTGTTAKDLWQSRMIVAAKRLIFFSDMSMKEIAYELGFSEASHFSAFFKKCTGQSPASFKKHVASDQSQ